jgi:divalent metal cation (Fe/Co/Zn/Cd) transporter
MHMGPLEVLLNLKLVFRPQLSADDVGRVVDRLETRIRDRYPEVRRIYVEAGL